MIQYKLVYLQPYEVDWDSPSGVGDHSIQHSKRELNLEAKTDKDALVEVGKFLQHGSVVFDHYLDGDGKTHMRSPVELSTTRVIRKWNNK